jgi:hypothetical protein
MNIKMALDTAKIALELKQSFVTIKREALEALIKSAGYDPEIRYVSPAENAIIHKLADGTKVLLMR